MRDARGPIALLLTALALVGGLYLSGYLALLLLGLDTGLLEATTWYQYIRVVDHPQVARYAARLNDRFGLPIRSEAPVYDIYEVRPKAPTEVFVSDVAPTSELDGQVTRVASIGNDLAPHQELVIGRGLGTPIAAIAAESAPPSMPRGPGLARSLGAAGLAATAYDALSTHAKAADLREHGSVLAAQSEWTHFAGRNAGDWAGAVAGARLGVMAFGKTPHSAVAGGIDGGVTGVLAGERITELEDAKRIFRRTDRDGVAWTFDGRRSASQARNARPRSHDHRPRRSRPTSPTLLRHWRHNPNRPSQAAPRRCRSSGRCRAVRANDRPCGTN